MATTKLHSEAILQGLLARSEVPALVELASALNKPSDRACQYLNERNPYTKAAEANVMSAASLADAYMAYWMLSEREPLETFGMIYRHIIRLESMTDPPVAWRTLREAATAFHSETGHCPFCGNRGSLHLPAEQPQSELLRGRV